MDDVAAIVLAAGGSSRLGRPKQLVTVDGQTLLARVIATAAVVAWGPIIVVLGRDADACQAQIGHRATTIVNEAWASGMGSSLRVGANALPATVRWAFVLLCDQPRVTADTLRRLDAARRGPGIVACVASYAGTVGPPLLVSKPLIERLRDWPNREGAKALWSDGGASIVTVPCPEGEFDIDTLDDLRRVGVV